VAAWSKAWTLSPRSNARIVGSNLLRGMNVCVRLFCVCAVLCPGRGLASGWSPVQGVNRLYMGLRNWKSDQGSIKDCRITDEWNKLDRMGMCCCYLDEIFSANFLEEQYSLEILNFSSCKTGNRASQQDAGAHFSVRSQIGEASKQTFRICSYSFHRYTVVSGIYFRQLSRLHFRVMQWRLCHWITEFIGFGVLRTRLRSVMSSGVWRPCNLVWINEKYRQCLRPKRGWNFLNTGWNFLNTRRCISENNTPFTKFVLGNVRGCIADWNIGTSLAAALRPVRYPRKPYACMC
jgi:hypothetical protein